MEVKLGVKLASTIISARLLDKPLWPHSEDAQEGPQRSWVGLQCLRVLYLVT